MHMKLHIHMVAGIRTKFHARSEGLDSVLLLLILLLMWGCGCTRLGMCIYPLLSIQPHTTQPTLAMLSPLTTRGNDEVPLLLQPLLMRHYGKLTHVWMCGCGMYALIQQSIHQSRRAGAKCKAASKNNLV